MVDKIFGVNDVDGRVLAFKSFGVNLRFMFGRPFVVEPVLPVCFMFLSNLVVGGQAWAVVGKLHALVGHPCYANILVNFSHCLKWFLLVSIHQKNSA